MSDDVYNTKDFPGTDLSSPTRKRQQAFGGIEAGYNYENGDHGEVLLVTIDAMNGSRSMVVLTEGKTLELLNHLNDLLGKPMGYAPTAGMAPSAD